MDRAKLIQELHDSEINATFAWLHPHGFCWYLGDNNAGFEATGYAEKFDQAVDDLCAAAIEKFPKSQFADNRKGDKP